MTQLDDLQAYVNFEMVRRGVMLPSLLVDGYDGDPNDVAAPDILKDSPVGTRYVQTTGPKEWVKLEAGSTTWTEVEANVAETRTLYVGKHGNDTGNDGLNVGYPFLTIGAAIAAATALSPTEASPVTIRIHDAGVYKEVFDLPDWTHLIGPAASVVWDSGTPSGSDIVQAGEGCIVCLARVEAAVTGTYAVSKTFGSVGTTIFHVAKIISTNSARCVASRAVDGRLYVISDEWRTSLRAFNGINAAEVYLDVGKIVLTADNAVGIFTSSAVKLMGSIGAIEEDGALTGTYGIRCNTGDGEQITLVAGSINVDTAFDIPVGATLNLTASQLIGTRTAGGTVNLQVAGEDEAIGTPGSTTDNALSRWDGTDGGAIQNSGVTLSDTDAMVFPASGSISKPSLQSGAEAYGANAVADALDGLAVGKDATVGNNAYNSTAIGQGSSVSASSLDCVVIGQGSTVTGGSNGSYCTVVGAQATAARLRCTIIGEGAKGDDFDNTVVGQSAAVFAPSAGSNQGAIAIGHDAEIGNTVPGAANGAAIVIGTDAKIAPGAANAVSIGPNAKANTPSSGDNNYVIAIGSDALVNYDSGAGCTSAICIGHSAAIYGGGARAVCVGETASSLGGANQVVVGYGAKGDVDDGIVSVGHYAWAYPEFSIAIGSTSRVYEEGAGDSSGAIALGKSAVVGKSGTPEAGCGGAIAIGLNSLVNYGSIGSIGIGAGCNVSHSCLNTVALGAGVSVSSGSEDCTVVGQGATVTGGVDRCTILGKGVSSASADVVAIGYGSTVSAGAQESVVVGSGLTCEEGRSVLIGLDCTIHNTTAGDSFNSILIGSYSSIASGGANGCDAAIGIGSSVSIGDGCLNTICIGANATADAGCYGSVIIGQGADGNQYFRSVVIGQVADSLGNNATVVGWQAQAGALAVALGYRAAVAQAASSGIAIGRDSLSDGGIALGSIAKALTNSSIAIGSNTTINSAISGDSDSAIAIGTNSVIGGSGEAGCGAAICIGFSASVAPSAEDAVCMGASASAATTANAAISVGSNAAAADTGQVIIGTGAIGGSAGEYGVALGGSARADGNQGTCVGYQARVDNDYGVAVGPLNPRVEADFGVALGANARVLIGHTEAIAIGRSSRSTAAHRCTIGTVSGSQAKELQIGLGLAVWGATPPASQPTKISDPTDLASALTAIASIIDVLEGAGLSSAT